MGDLIVGNDFGKEEIKRVILENTASLSQNQRNLKDLEEGGKKYVADVYHCDINMVNDSEVKRLENYFKREIKKETKEAKQQTENGFYLIAEEAIKNPNKITVVKSQKGDYYSGYFDDECNNGQLLLAERTMEGCDGGAADYIFKERGRAGSLQEFNGLLGHLFSRARLRIYRQKGQVNL